ncbi:sugar ABC transporter ATP-binding protein [Kineothrix sp. MB12-C1]|uniref:sugar ABC transporter ATP-binding protein n=1 Tax=Kineothrix sp. MB12-C1 TaxID=3070215 RepID=UPI0027D2F58F|nr:sugar ABC transporter ATP-binding protein [Kineothrix sp. MB12-C1]WMC93989.1 sugar ABC transporter ATP-binding protein [Kineothrix sp. MB12-C1]
MDNEILKVKHVIKKFNGIPALNDISFTIRRGEVHALMGENGAGKSTFIKILTGIYQKDEGHIIFEDKECDFHGSLDAQHAGISTIYQELNMIPYLTVSENIFLGRYPQNATGIDWNTMNKNAQKMIDDLGIHIDVKKKLNEYGTAKQQIISIIRAISLEARLIVMDEPTSSLDTNEVNILFEIMDKLKSKGITIIFVSHRLSEIYEKCDRLTILKDGQYEGTYDIDDISELDLVKKMIGKNQLDLDNKRKAKDLSKEEVVLDVKNIVRTPYVNDISFKVKKGEVLGLAGLLGSGRTELVRLIFGCDQMDSGEIFIDGKKTIIKTPEDAVKNKLAFCTENRREEGIFPFVSVKNNMVICSLDELVSGLFINNTKRLELVDKYIKKLQIKTASREQLIKNLSGGNQQKVLLARWISTRPKLIILDEPTRGIDIGAKAEIEKIIRELSDEGISIIYISSEIQELVRNCDRVIVLREGKICGELDTVEISEMNIMKFIASDEEGGKS